MHSFRVVSAINECQDTFDHDKGQKSAISGHPKCEKIARSPGREKSVESCHVSGCDVFARSEKFSIQLFLQGPVRVGHTT